MNVSEDVIQERIELLEGGEPLEVCLAGLTDEEADAVSAAASLRQVTFTFPTGAAIAAQHATIIAAARQLLPPRPAASLIFMEKLRAAWGALFIRRERALGLVGLVALVFVFAGIWLLRSSDAPPTASLPQDEKPVVETTSSDTINLPIIEPKPDATEPATIAAAGGASLSPYQLFVPLISLPLLAGPEQAALHDIHGYIEIMAADGQWTPVTANTNVPAGTRIRTGLYSNASLAFFDGSQTRLGPSAEISLDQVKAFRPETGFRTIVMTQWAGESNHQVQFRNDGGSRYEVKTPTGSGLARGTQFAVNVMADGRARYTVSEGKVDVTNDNRTVVVIAGQTTSFTADEPPVDPKFIVTGTGVVTQIGETWIIAGQSFTVNVETVILGAPQIGDWVYVEGHLVTEGDPVAETIQRLQEDEENEFTLTGPVDSIGDESWIVAGQAISLTADTAVDEGIELGDTVRVTGLIQLPGGHLVAGTIELVIEDDGLPFEFAGIVQSISDEKWTISGITIVVNEETQIEDGIDVGDTVRVEGIILADNTWLAHEIDLLVEEEATFSFTGDVMSMDPWLVAGIPFELAEWATVEPGIELGDIVHVSGIILEDGTWLATEIDLLQDDLLQIVFVGVVDSIEPWIISGLPITTDENTVIVGDIAIDDLVRVTAWIRNDGTWLATQIERLNSGMGEGCVAITAVITAINGDEIFLTNGQTIILDEGIVIEGELQVGSVVLIIACVAEDGTINIVSITIIYTPPTPSPTPVPPPPGQTPPPGPNGNVTICHKPGSPAEQTKTVPESALGGHLGHGDTMGPCP